MIRRNAGYFYVPEGVNPWPHEIRIAKILKEAGHAVKFIPESANRTADITLDGIEYEIKSPRSNKIRMIEKNLKRASRQCPNIIIDSSRIKNLRDDALQSFLTKQLKNQRGIKRLIFIKRTKETIDINKLV